MFRIAAILLLIGMSALAVSFLVPATHVEADALQTIFWLCWAGLLLGLLLDRRTRRQRDFSRAAGYCEYCGYDLRATPLRCPECGSVPSLRPMIRHTRLWEVPKERGWLFYAGVGVGAAVAMLVIWVKFR